MKCGLEGVPRSVEGFESLCGGLELRLPRSVERFKVAVKVILDSTS